VVESHRIVPLREDARSITVATSDPVSLSTELELEQLTGRRPDFAVAPPTAISAALEEIFGAGAVSGRRTGARPLVDPAPERRASERPPLTSTPATDPADGAVLLVDDEPSVRLLLRSILQKRGHRVVEAEDGIAALEAIAVRPEIRLVVADLNMPRMDGLELVWKLRDEGSGPRLPVIVVTGEADEILETQLLEEGADDYIRKPIDPRLFLARVEAAGRRSESASARTGVAPRSG
jgi:two-component system chemotaxis response regulator CheY